MSIKDDCDDDRRRRFCLPLVVAVVVVVVVESGGQVIERGRGLVEEGVYLFEWLLSFFFSTS